MITTFYFVSCTEIYENGCHGVWCIRRFDRDDIHGLIHISTVLVGNKTITPRRPITFHLPSTDRQKCQSPLLRGLILLYSFMVCRMKTKVLWSRYSCCAWCSKDLMLMIRFCKVFTIQRNAHNLNNIPTNIVYIYISLQLGCLLKLSLSEC